MEDIRALIRDLLREELRSLRTGAGTGVSRETVRIGSDADLAAFVRRVLHMAQDPARRADIENGRVVFALDRAAPAPAPADAAPRAAAASEAPAVSPRRASDKKLLQERDIDMLPQGTAVLTVARSTRLTPLAQDELRRRKIKIERAPQ